MTRILVLAYYFPPLGGAGVQRTVKLVKYLRELGYEPTVVTGASDDVLGWAPQDESLARDVPDDLEVVRAPATPPSTSRRRERAARWLGRRSPFETWWRREATRLGEGLVENVELVYASMSPFGTAEAAAALASRARVPWVADLRDPWALDEWSMYPTAVHRYLDRTRMRRALRSAAAVIMNTSEAASALVREFPELASRRVITVPNGWDRDDFAPPAEDAAQGPLRVVYAGYSHVRPGHRHGLGRSVRTLLGGAAPGLDALARSHVFLLAAVRRLLERRPDLTGRFELHLAGPARLEPERVAGMNVVHHGYLAHDEALALVRSADLLFLPMHDLAPGTRSRAVPGKTYEYLASGRTILAAVPDGDARDLLGGVDGAWLCRPRDVEGMADALAEIAALDRPLQWARDVERFERRRLAVSVADLFDELLGRRREGAP